jgi:hypothetical protein
LELVLFARRGLKSQQVAAKTGGDLPHTKDASRRARIGPRSEFVAVGFSISIGISAAVGDGEVDSIRAFPSVGHQIVIHVVIEHFERDHGSSGAMQREFEVEADVAAARIRLMNFGGDDVHAFHQHGRRDDVGLQNCGFVRAAE